MPRRVGRQPENEVEVAAAMGCKVDQIGWYLFRMYETGDSYQKIATELTHAAGRRIAKSWVVRRVKREAGRFVK